MTRLLKWDLLAVAALVIGVVIIFRFTGVWISSPTGLPPGDGSNKVLLCRGGTQQGDFCRQDTDCPGGICSYLGHPRRCASTYYCQVSSEVPCTDDLDCPLWPEDRRDYCREEAIPTVPCTTSADCGVCVGGERKGWACTADRDCSSSTCARGTGTCINGIEQCTIVPPRIVSGAAHDVIADFVIGSRTLEDDQQNAVTARSMARPVGVAYDKAHGRLFVTDSWTNTVRTMVWTSTPADFGPADVFLQAVDATHAFWQLLPGDLTIDSFESQTERTSSSYNQNRFGAAADPVDGGVWVADFYRAIHFPRLSTGGHADIALGQSDLYGTRARSLAVAIQLASDLAVATRCKDSGAACSRNRECASGACIKTVAVTDVAFSRVMVWNDPKASGMPADMILGQATPDEVGCNKRGRSAASLCRPGGVAFDATGALWVADTGNNRVLKYAADFSSGATAVLVIGQKDFVSAEPAHTATGLNGPLGIDFFAAPMADTLVVADSLNHRVVSYPAPHVTGQAATQVFGQPDLDANQAATSSDGKQCDRLNGPSDVAVDNANNVWIADEYNARVLRTPVGFWSGSPSGSGSADIRLGQSSCKRRHSHQVNGHSFGADADSHAGYNQGGIAFFANGKATGVCLVDSPHSRILCWDELTTARQGERDADAVLGQPDFTSYDPNQGGHPSAVGLWHPQLIGASDAALYVADTENNRVLKYGLGSPPHRLTTNQAANVVFGQPNLEMDKSPCPEVSSSSLCHPTAAKVDAEGNLWVIAGRDGGSEARVLLFCQTPGTLGGLCTAQNASDTIADLVIGKPDFRTGVSPDDCLHPTATSLCRPRDVINDVGRSRLIVSDGAQLCVGGPNDGLACAREADCLPGGMCGAKGGRVLVYPYPLRNGAAATVSIGGTLTSYDQSHRAVCTGGPHAGAVCASVLEELRQGTSSRGEHCLGADDFKACTADNDCPQSHACGCQGGYCDWSKTFHGSPGGLALHPTRDILWVGRGAGALEFVGPLTNDSRAHRVGGENTAHAFWNGGSGYISCQWNYGGGGLEFDPSGDLYIMNGGDSENVSAVFVVSDPTEPSAATGGAQTSQGRIDGDSTHPG